MLVSFYTKLSAGPIAASRWPRSAQRNQPFAILEIFGGLYFRFHTLWGPLSTGTRYAERRISPLALFVLEEEDALAPACSDTPSPDRVSFGVFHL